MANYFVFDCEANGLYGESFAVVYVLVNREGRRLQEGIIATDSGYASGLPSNYTWARENVKINWSNLPSSGIYAQRTPSLTELRNCFWYIWIDLKRRDLIDYAAADCLFPVEANFLADCVKQSEYERQWQAPYPFIDISTLLLACGKNPKAEYERLEDELPKHDPLTDARQSARIMIECFNQLNLFNIPK